MADASQTMDSNQSSDGSWPLWKKIAVTLVTVLIVAGLVYASTQLWSDEDAIKARLTDFLAQARGTPWALPLVIVSYIVGSLILFPIILLNLVVAMVFGYWGIVYGLIGIMADAAFYYGIGAFFRRRGGKEWLEKSKFQPFDKKLNQIGLAGLVTLHTLPAPPFTMMNIIAGISSISIGIYLLGTFLAMLPGAIARGIVGDSLTKIILNPTPESWMYLGGGIVLWVVLVGGAHILLKRFQKSS